MHFQSNGNGTPVITHKSTAILSYISTFIYVFQERIVAKVGGHLNFKSE